MELEHETRKLLINLLLKYRKKAQEYKIGKNISRDKKQKETYTKIYKDLEKILNVKV